MRTALEGASCLVTGGSGFIGRPLVRTLERQGSRVTVVNRSPLAGTGSLSWDLRRPDLELGRRIDHVFHLAALAHVEPLTKAQADDLLAVNVDGTRNLLGALDRRGDGPASFVYVSSVAVYGLGEGEQLDETTDRRATDPYGLSKRMAEDLVLEWGEQRSVKATIVRLPLVAGPAAPGNLGRMVAAISSGRYLGVGSGTARRSMVRLHDVVAILPALVACGGAFHLTDGRHPSFAELERSVAKALGRRAPRRLPRPLARAAARAGDAVEALVRRPMPFNSRALARMTSTLTFSDERARRSMGWEPTGVLESVHELLGERLHPDISPWSPDGRASE